MLEVVVGRDASTGKLSLAIGSKVQLVGTEGMVPRSVSRQHCSLALQPDGTFLVCNLKPQNITLVNGIPIQKKSGISSSAKITLGTEDFVLPLDQLLNLFPKTADIRPLETIWEQYDMGKTKQQVLQNRFNALRGVTGMLTILGSVLSVILHGTIIVPILSTTAIVVMIAITVKSYRDASKYPNQQKMLHEQFQDNYRCPCCNSFLGFTSYRQLSKNDRCPYCKSTFRK